jgi:diguanylate cyclase (GGDEF)-like protein
MTGVVVRARDLVTSAGALLPGAIVYAVAIAVSRRAGYDVLRDGWLANVALTGPGLVCLGRTVFGTRGRRASLWLGLAMLSFAAGNIAYVASIQYQVEPAVPSLADVGYLGFYPLALAGVVTLLRRGGALTRGAVLDGLLGAVCAATALAVVFTPVLTHLDGDLAEVLVTGAYPVGDLLIVSLIAGALAIGGMRGTGAIGWIAAGLMIFCAADVTYGLRVAADTYRIGTVLDLLWPLGMLVMAIGLGRPVRAAAPRERDSVAVLAAPLAATVAGTAVLLWATRADLPPITIALATASLVLAAARTLLSFRELQRLADARRQARTDDLTGLANRRALYEQAEERLGRAAPDARHALLLVDLDGFKEINDALGHHAGDELLFQVARSLGARHAPGDVLARLGGDEFALLVALEDADAIAIARQVLDRVAEPRRIEGVRMQVRASIGVAEFPRDGDTLSALLRRADIAMYEAKRRRSGAERFLPGHDRHSRDRLQVAQDIADAIDGDQLVLHYQPRCDVRTGAVAGVEALVRWQHPERGLLMPDAFLEQVERSGLMARLSASVLAMAARQAREWRDAGLELAVAVNLSVSDLLDESLPQRIAALLEEHELDAGALEVEVTESLLLTDPDRARRTLADLRALGVAVAIDDYGTGYSSPALLRDLPADQLKIDRSFIAEMGADARIAAIVRSTVELARALGLEAVAEGVEDADALARLAAMGCDWAQGYHFSRPLPPAELAAWVALPQAA